MYNDPLGSIKAVHSDDFGASWSYPAVEIPIPGGVSHMAPATGIQLSSTHRTAPNRLLVVAIIQSSCHEDKVLFSDNGVDWHLSPTPIANCGEAQLAELLDGTVLMNCRNPTSVDNGHNRTVVVLVPKITFLVVVQNNMLLLFGSHDLLILDASVRVVEKHTFSGGGRGCSISLSLSLSPPPPHSSLSFTNSTLG
jgi:hypothetical protein